MSIEKELENELNKYKEQLNQINSLIEKCESNENAGQNDELKQLKIDLDLLVKLTEENLIEEKKKNLLLKLESIEQKSNKEKFEKTSKVTTISETETKFRIYYDCPNTNIKMHNVLILKTEPERNTAKVIFCNPTDVKMKTCEHFMNNTCKFEQKCKYSHGYEVNVDQLNPYLEPKFNKIKIGMDCLAKHKDSLWHLAKIESVDPQNICVQFKKFNCTSALEWHDIFVLDQKISDYSNNETDEEITDEEESTDYEETSDEDEQATDEDSITDDEIEIKNKNMIESRKKFLLPEFGDWEKHTKGIGSKLMMKMGYTEGKGLGKHGEGKVEPVEIIVLPERGISLDKVMQIKHKKNLKRLKSIQKINSQTGSGSNLQEEKSELNVFDFINNTLAIKKQPSKSSNSHLDLSKINSKGLNIQTLETHNKIQEAEKSILKLNESLKRNKDKTIVNRIKQKLEEQEKDLSTLKKNLVSFEQSQQKKKSKIF